MAEEGEGNVLTPEVVGDSLSALDRTLDGKSYAFTALSLRGKELTSFGDALQPLEHVRSLDAGENKLGDADSISSLPSLLTASLDSNEIKKLPPLAELKYFQILNINSNQIETLEGASSPSLTNFSCNANSLASLKGLSGLSSVKRAEFRGNKLTSIDCGNCPSLEEIVIAENELESLKGVTSFPSIVSLNADNNKIAKIDDVEWDKLESLSELSMANNALDKAAVAPLAAAANLKVLNLEGNPIAEEEQYRIEVILQLPQVESIDGTKITKAEREEAAEEAARRKAEAEAAAAEAAGEGEEGEEEG